MNKNSETIYKNNSSGVRGVAWSKAYGKWRAQIYVDGKVHQLGLYHDIRAAELVRRKAQQLILRDKVVAPKPKALPKAKQSDPTVQTITLQEFLKSQGR